MITPVIRARNIVYRDFFMASRLPAYRRLMETIVARGYQSITIDDFWALVRNDRIDPARRYALIRHDIDTDPETARDLWRIEQSLDLQGSWYFRLSTIDVPLMRAIAAAGGEASYHYEELATVAKRRRLADPDTLEGHLTEARDLFRTNIERLRRATDLSMRTAASHGDFVNRKLGCSNTMILEDRVFRASVGIVAETYDDELIRHVTTRIADDLAPAFWRPSDPRAAIERGDHVVYLLIHPRNWRANRPANLRDDLQRLKDGISYGVPRFSRRRPSRTGPVRSSPTVRATSAARAPDTLMVDPATIIGDGMTLGAFVVLGGPDAGGSTAEGPLEIGRDATIRSHTVIYAGARIGDRFHAGHGVLIREGTTIGDDVSVGSHTVIEHHVTIGDRVRIHSNAFIPEYSVLEEGSWVGPNAVLTNARYPLSPSAKEHLDGPRVRPAAKIGANATLLPGVVIGDNALVGAGSVVTRDVADGTIVVGNPARVVGSIGDVPAYGDVDPPARRRSARARPAR